MFGGMWIFWLFLLGCGFFFWGYGPRYYPRRAYDNRENPIELARKRLAKGEITIEEFEKIKEAILNS
jgi:uncharacterized membrane protein